MQEYPKIFVILSGMGESLVKYPLITVLCMVDWNSGDHEFQDTLPIEHKAAIIDCRDYGRKYYRLIGGDSVKYFTKFNVAQHR